MLKVIYVLLIILLIFLFAFFVYNYLSGIRAKDAAISFVKDKYGIDVSHVRTSRTMFFHNYWQVTLSTKNIEEIEFDVIVRGDYSVYDTDNQYGFFSADNLCQKKFELNIDPVLKKAAVNIWGEKTDASLTFYNHAVYAFETVSKMNFNQSIEEMKESIGSGNYFVYIDLNNSIVSSVEAETEADRIVGFISWMKEENLYPNVLYVSYNDKTIVVRENDLSAPTTEKIYNLLTK